MNAIRTALYTALSGMSPALATVWANTDYVPTSDPYQIVDVLFADPDNIGHSSSPYRQDGYMQVRLMYPLSAGAHTAGTRAELIRSTFARGNSYTSGTVTTRIQNTASISGGSVEDGRWAVIVKVPFFANIT